MAVPQQLFLAVSTGAVLFDEHIEDLVVAGVATAANGEAVAEQDVEWTVLQRMLAAGQRLLRLGRAVVGVGLSR